MSTMKSEFASLRKTKQGVIFMSIVGGVALVLVLWTFVSFGVSVAQKRELIHNGVKTTATVTAKDSQFVVLRGGGFNSYTLSYTFTSDVLGHPQVTTHDKVEAQRQAWQDASVGSKIDVIYKQNNPTDNQLAAAVITGLDQIQVVIVYLIASFGMVYVASYFIKKLMPAKKKWNLLWTIGILAGSFFVGYWVTIGISALIHLLIL